MFSGILQKHDVSIVKRVSNLEGIDSISILGLDSLVDLSGSKSVVIESIIEFDFSDASQSLSSDQEISLSHDSFNFVVLGTQGTKYSCTDLFLSVLKVNWLFNHSQDLV